MQMFRPNIGTNVTVQTLTGATTIPTTAQVLLLSGTTFAVTLPAVASTTGQTFQFLKTDSISTAMSVTGTGFAGVTLSTKNEQYTVTSDGTTYWPIGHSIDSTVNTFAPTTFGFGTLGGSVFCGWSRRGGNISMFGRIPVGTPSGTTIGTFCLPSPLVAAGGSFLPVANQANIGMLGTNLANGSVFMSTINGGGTAITFGLIVGNPLAGAAVGASLASTNGVISILFDVPIQGWGA